MKTLILGLGNPILTDDGVGIHVARALAGRLDHADVTVVEANVGGLNLLDLLVDYDALILIDAIQTGVGKPGQIYRLEPVAFNTTRHNTTSHGIDFTTALEFGKRLGLALPEQITIFAIEAKDISSFSEECTPEVKSAILVCAEKVVRELMRMTSSPETSDLAMQQLLYLLCHPKIFYGSENK